MIRMCHNIVQSLMGQMCVKPKIRQLWTQANYKLPDTVPISSANFCADKIPNGNFTG